MRSPMPAGVVGNDESALLDDDGWSPVTAGVSRPPPPSPPLVNGKAMRSPGHVVTRLIRAPFAAVFRTTTMRVRAATATGASDDEQTMSNGGDTAAGVERRRREARSRPSLEQLLRMDSSRRPDRKSEPAGAPAAAPSLEVPTTCTAQEPLISPSRGHFTVVVSSDDERRRRAAAVPAVVKFDACGRRTITNAKRLAVVFESLRTCSRDPGASVVVPKPKGPDGKVAAAGRAPGKAELFYCRPIPMGRRCRVQHLEESPYK